MLMCNFTTCPCLSQLSLKSLVLCACVWVSTCVCVWSITGSYRSPDIVYALVAIWTLKYQRKRKTNAWISSTKPFLHFEFSSRTAWDHLHWNCWKRWGPILISFGPTSSLKCLFVFGSSYCRINLCTVPGMKKGNKSNSYTYSIYIVACIRNKTLINAVLKF